MHQNPKSLLREVFYPLWIKCQILGPFFMLFFQYSSLIITVTIFLPDKIITFFMALCTL